MVIKKTYSKGTYNKNPLVSVLIPVYNGIPYIQETIDSILNNNYKNFEIILVDDGSKDTSRQVCQNYAKNNKKIRFYSFEENRGMDHALNFGIKKAKGKYIARINQDDIMVADRLDLQVKFLESHRGYTAVGGQIILFTNDNPHFDEINFPLTDKEIKNNWLKLSPFSDPTVMYKRDAVLKTAGYNQLFWPADDVHMWYMLGNLGKLANLPEVLTKVRWHEGAGSIKSHRCQMKKTWEVHRWAEKHIQKPTFNVKMFWVCQYWAGMLFSAEFNWSVYRLIKKYPLHINILKDILNLRVSRLISRIALSKVLSLLLLF